MKVKHIHNFHLQQAGRPHGKVAACPTNAGPCCLTNIVENVTCKQCRKTKYYLERRRSMNEKEMREFKVPYFSTLHELYNFIDDLVKQPHDYGTSACTMSLAAVAAFNYIGNVLGTTGFQSSWAELDFLSRTRNLKHGFRILDYNNLLYPQYQTEEYFPSAETLIKLNAKMLKEEATKLLEEDNPYTHEDVIAWWKHLASLEVGDES